jgi:hypothetical protein
MELTSPKLGTLLNIARKATWRKHLKWRANVKIEIAKSGNPVIDCTFLNSSSKT